jgi:hypothetical protein
LNADQKYLFLVLVILIAILLRVLLSASSGNAQYTYNLITSTHEGELNLHVFLGLFLPILLLFKIALVVIAALSLYRATQLITHNEIAPIVAVLLYSINLTALYWENFSYWSGESLTPILAFAAIILLIDGLTQKKNFKVVISILITTFCFWVWIGGIYWLVLFIFAMAIYTFKNSMPLICLAIVSGFVLFSIGTVYLIAGDISPLFNFISLLLVGSEWGVLLGWQLLILVVISLSINIVPAAYSLIKLNQSNISERILFIMLFAGALFAMTSAGFLYLVYLPLIPFSAKGLTERLYPRS